MTDHDPALIDAATAAVPKGNIYHSERDVAVAVLDAVVPRGFRIEHVENHGHGRYVNLHHPGWVLSDEGEGITTFREADRD